MKLRNKKTGEIKAFDEVMREAYKWNNYNSLAELNAEWEDYEEPQEYWYIDIDGVVATNAWDFDDDTVKGMRTIGNYFKTKEEAEKVVEKLKAWKRLKDKGFRFNGIGVFSNTLYFEIDKEYDGGHVVYDESINTDNKLKEYNEDLEMLFGDEQ